MSRAVRNPSLVAEVIRLLHYERETWSMLVQKLVDENTSARGLAEIPQATPPVPPASAANGLVCGSISVQG